MEKGVSEGLDPAGLFPQFDRAERREMEFLGTDGVHFLSDNLGNFLHHPLAERQEGVDTGRK
jgi:hypothetical protein